MAQDHTGTFGTVEMANTYVSPQEFQDCTNRFLADVESAPGIKSVHNGARIAAATGDDIEAGLDAAFGDKELEKLSQEFNARAAADRRQILARIKSDFASHRADEVGQTKMTAIRQGCYLLAQVLVETVPSGRELSTALTNLEQVMFHANAGISRPYPAI